MDCLLLGDEWSIFLNLERSLIESLRRLISLFLTRLLRIKENPEIIGKPLLHTNPALWEFKAEVYRAFYIIQENINEVWLLSVKHKDECDAYIRRGYSKDISEF